MKTVLFDLDGTLLDGSGLPDAMRSTCEAVAADLPQVTADDLVAANTAAWQRLWPDVEDDWMLGGRDGDEVSRDAWRQTLAGCGVTDAAVLDRAVAEWRRQEERSFRLFPDALPTLDRLAAAGVRLGLVTNGAAAIQRRKLEVVGLTGRLDPIVISSEAGAKKPDPAIFAIALAALGAPAEDVVFVGDNLWHDVPGATASGICTIWLDRHGFRLRPEWPQPDAVISGLEQLAVPDVAR